MEQARRIASFLTCTTTLSWGGFLFAAFVNDNRNLIGKDKGKRDFISHYCGIGIIPLNFALYIKTIPLKDIHVLQAIRFSIKIDDIIKSAIACRYANIVAFSS